MYSKGIWSTEEHERFLQALRANPQASWLELSEIVVTRSPRQVQSHAQKYNAKINRHARGLRKVRRHLSRKEHRIERETRVNEEPPPSTKAQRFEDQTMSFSTLGQDSMMELLSFDEPALNWNESDVYEAYAEFLLPLFANEGLSPSGVEMEMYMTYV